MMLSRRHIYTAASALYLFILTAFAAWALHRTQSHRLPIPTTLAAFSLALPGITGFALQALTGTANTSLSTVKWSPRLGSRNTWSQYAITLSFILEAVLATLAGTYVAPAGDLRCGLDTRWRDLYHQKNERAIRSIQDAFRCCGLHSPVDMAYPFPSRDRGANACRIAYGRETSCFDPWRAEERYVAGVVLAVVAGVAAWKMVVIYVQGRRASWADEGVAAEEGADGERRALEYHEAEGPYRDQPDVEDVGDEENYPALRVVPSRLRDAATEEGDVQR